MSESFEYDVFLSHSAQDKAAVRELARRLTADGLRVWPDERQIGISALPSCTIERRLKQSRTLVLVMSANAFAEDWATLERHTALFRDPTNAQRRFIPLRLDDTPLPDILKQYTYVDWRQPSDEQYAQLVEGCGSARVETTTASEQDDEGVQSRILTEYTDRVYRVAITPDGRRAVSSSEDRTVRVWDLGTGQCLHTLKGHTQPVVGVAITADGQHVVSGSHDQTIRVWDLSTGVCTATLEGHTGTLMSVAITADGRLAFSGSSDQTIRVWDLSTGVCIATLEGHTAGVDGVAVTPDGRRVVSGAFDRTGRVWDLSTGVCIATLEGHTGTVMGVAITADGRLAFSGSSDQTIRVWDLDTGVCIATLEGHTQAVYGLVVTPDGRRAVSGSNDQTIRVWDLDTSHCIATLRGHTDAVVDVAMTADGQRAISASSDNTVRVWDLPPLEEPHQNHSNATLYTNAKVLLVGDSGVGKSGLALRLTEDRFAATISTDAAWATQMKLPGEVGVAGVEREIWLWDFAGQADYRLIHQLYMDETALAVLVFNPQSENPFEGLGQWDRDLQRAARRPFRKLLVAGRCDRGGLMISRASVEEFGRERGFAGYLETSAQTGSGCQELREAIINSIDWQAIPWTSSPRIFKLLKDEIVRLKDEGKVLLRLDELRQQLEMRLPGESFTSEQLRAVVGLLAGPGIVWQLEFGDFVLLQPERINAYAAAVIRSVRAHIEEIGCIAEAAVLDGRLDYQDLRRLPRSEEQIVLRAMHQTLVERGLCLREHTDIGTLLIFPSYFKRERPPQPDHPAALVTYSFSGPLDEIYATLVVRLHHTAAFEKDRLWRFAADFKTLGGKRVGLKMTKQGEGAAAITVYLEPEVSDETKATFIRYVHEHLRAKDPALRRDRHYVCPHCNTPVENRPAIEQRLSRGLKDIVCGNCEQRVELWDLIEQLFASNEVQQRVRELDALAGIKIDNESRELILVGHAFAIAGEAGQIFRPSPNSDWGIDGEIEFKNDQGAASARRVYLQLKSGDSYLAQRKSDGKEIFTIKNPRHAEYWQAQAYPVMLVIRTSNGQIRWMNVTDYLTRHGKQTRQIVFEGEPFTALNLVRLRDRVLR